MATDIDPNAIRATNENFAINEVSEQAEVQQVNILDKEEADSFYEKNNGTLLMMWNFRRRLARRNTISL